jgi:hydrogenase maturation protease
LSVETPPTTFVIGIGNLLRRDDGVGLFVAQRLRDRVPAGVEVRACAADLCDLALWLCRCQRALLVDAASGLAPGEVVRLDVFRTPLPRRKATSSHALPLSQAVALAEALGPLPTTLGLYAIGASDFGFGEGLSPLVAAAAETTIRQILAELSSPPHPL